jgi:FkbM family methyltransferase
MSRDDYGWNWGAFRGDEAALKYARRDLADLDRVLGYVPGRRVAVQAGGSLGIYPKRLAQVFAAVYTFEADVDNFVKLVLNAPERHIYRYQAALGYHPILVGTSRVRRDGKDRPSHDGTVHTDGSGMVPTWRVDELHLPICDLLCLDVEGDELKALWGASHTLEACRPVLMVEINVNIKAAGFSEDDVRAYLRSKQYAFWERLHSDEVWIPAERQGELTK